MVLFPAEDWLESAGMNPCTIYILHTSTVVLMTKRKAAQPAPIGGSRWMFFGGGTMMYVNIDDGVVSFLLLPSHYFGTYF